MSKANFKVMGALDSSGRPTQGTVTIDRGAGLFIVRPLRRRRTYVLPLSDVATMVCRKIIFAEVAELKRKKAEARKARSRR